MKPPKLPGAEKFRFAEQNQNKSSLLLTPTSNHDPTLAFAQCDHHHQQQQHARLEVHEEEELHESQIAERLCVDGGATPTTSRSANGNHCRTASTISSSTESSSTSSSSSHSESESSPPLNNDHHPSLRGCNSVDATEGGEGAFVRGRPGRQTCPPPGSHYHHHPIVDCGPNSMPYGSNNAQSSNSTLSFHRHDHKRKPILPISGRLTSRVLTLTHLPLDSFEVRDPLLLKMRKPQLTGSTMSCGSVDSGTGSNNGLLNSPSDAASSSSASSSPSTTSSPRSTTSSYHSADSITVTTRASQWGKSKSTNGAASNVHRLSTSSQSSWASAESDEGKQLGLTSFHPSISEDHTVDDDGGLNFDSTTVLGSWMPRRSPHATPSSSHLATTTHLASTSHHPPDQNII